MHDRSKPTAFGIIGEDLSHTLSPRIHTYLFEQANLDCSYHIFEVGSAYLRQAVEGIRALGIGGVNVTFPHKEKVAAYLDDLGDHASRVGAVNTIDNTSGGMVGHNTDVTGLISTLDRRMRVTLEGKTVMILGAGGAARACLGALFQLKPTKILVLNRTLEHARTMVAGVGASETEPEVSTVGHEDIHARHSERNIDLLINATSADPSFLKGIIATLTGRDRLRCASVLDLNYGSRALSGESVPGGVEYVDGLHMLCAQAVESFRMWTGVEADPETVYRYLTQNPGKR